MILEFLPIEFSEIPVSKKFEIAENNYNILARYNSRGEFLTIEILDENNVSLYITKILYWEKVNKFYIDDNLVNISLAPIDSRDVEIDGFQHEKITDENFNSDGIRVFIIL